MSWRPVEADHLPELLAERIAARDGVVRVAVDGAPATDPARLAARLVAPLQTLGRRAVLVSALGFWRDASLRFEFGREDVESYLGWLDHDALRREVLAPARARHRVLPSLRDPVTNRSTRAAEVELDHDSAVIVTGSLLLGLGLPFDLAIHLHAPADQLERDTPADQAWTLPAYAEYESIVRPAEIADIAIRVGRRTPAVRGL